MIVDLKLRFYFSKFETPAGGGQSALYFPP